MPEQYELHLNSIALYIATELSADDDTNGFLGKSIHIGSEKNQSEADIIASIGGNKTVAAIEISEKHVFQAFCRDNTPISPKPLINAITVWADRNSYSIDDDIFDV